MLLQETLTKENFWNEMMEKFPKATKVFCNWIDEYKKAVNWLELFNGHRHQNAITPKFHEIPYAMQQGIWIEFANHELNECFEQPEYDYNGDLEEDIKIVFAELEKVYNECGVD